MLGFWVKTIWKVLRVYVFFVFLLFFLSFIIFFSFSVLDIMDILYFLIVFFGKIGCCWRGVFWGIVGKTLIMLNNFEYKNNC